MCVGGGCGQGAGRARLGRGTVCLNKVYANVGLLRAPALPPTPAQSTPPLTSVCQASSTLVEVNIGVQVTRAVTVTDPPKMGREALQGQTLLCWSLPLLSLMRRVLPGHFSGKVVWKDMMNCEWFKRRASHSHLLPSLRPGRAG